MKKRNLLMAALCFVLFGLTLNVNAENPAVDATKCEDGKVYTNYYFFLDVGGNPENGEDYTTIGYYKNSIIPTSLKAIGESKGIMSDEFAEIAERTRGVVPISLSNQTQSLSINGVGITTFYNVLTGSANSSGNDTYLVEHNWSRKSGQVVQHTNNNSLKFSASQMDEMIAATVILNKSSLGYVEDNTYPDFPTAFIVNRAYSQGYTPSSATPMIIEGPEEGTADDWPAYLQPTLYYIQYCAKKTGSDTPTSFVIRYDANTSDKVNNVPETSSQTNVGTCAYVSKTLPTRSGYTFLGWSTNKSAKSADSTYAIGRCYKGEQGDITLYAVWKGNSVPNPGTGIASHIAAYAIIIALGVGGLLLARKKGLFRQI